MNFLSEFFAIFIPNSRQEFFLEIKFFEWFLCHFATFFHIFVKGLKKVCDMKKFQIALFHSYAYGSERT